MPASPPRVVSGPTWSETKRGKKRFLYPQFTLGWDILEWTGRYLRQPDGPDAGAPWNYTDEQMRFLLWWYAIDKQGRFVYRYGMLRRVKGWGKDPVGATICAIEFIGPCRFDGWAAPGVINEPKPHPAAWVMTAAVAKDQTRNTMTLFPGLFSAEAIAAYGIDLGKEIIYAHQGRSRLEAVTSSARALEGARASFVLKNETQHWRASNEGHAMSEVIARNATKSRDGSSRALAISNAHEPGEDSDAERDYDAWLAIQAGKSPGTGFLYDSLEAPPLDDLSNELHLRAGLRAARGDSIWLDEDRHVEEIYDARNSPSTSRRFYLNQVVATEDKWIQPAVWESGNAPDHEVPAGAIITVGVDGARFVDALAMVATEVATGYQWPLGIWERPEHADDDYEHPMEEVEELLDDAFRQWTIWRVYIDPGSSIGNIYPLVEKWEGRWGPKKIIRWTMNRLRQTAAAVAKYEDAVTTGATTHSIDPLFSEHVRNAVRRVTRMMDDDAKPLYVISKERPHSPRKIDAAAAAVLSWEARSDCIAAGEAEPKKAYRTAGFH